MITLPLAAALTAAILSTSFISGVFGMAGGMILMGILLAIMPVAAAMVLHGVTQMASNGWRAWLWRAHIRWPIVASYAAGAVLAALAFTAAQVVPSKPVALIIIGLTPFVGLVLPSRVVPDPTRRLQGVGCGAICTVLMLLAGVSGPIFDVFFVRSRLDRKEMIATKGAIQVFGHFLKVAYFGQFLAVSGVEVAPAAVLLALALPAVGTHLSRRVLDAMSDAQFRRWTRGLIVAVAAVYLVQGFYGLFLDLGGGAVIAATLS
jgi:uncharacterized protein